jgi:EEF1A lysine methyltransferase 2
MQTETVSTQNTNGSDAPAGPEISHLTPSQLGTRKYWDDYYQNDIDNVAEGAEAVDPADLESWFDDVGAPTKTLEYLTSDEFPLSARKDSCSVLDLGTGNGSALFSLRAEGGYTGTLVGIDYSEQSIQLATKLKNKYASDGETVQLSVNDMTFDVFNLLSDSPHEASWWPRTDQGFDLVLDKGTFDAVSLSSETTTADDGSERALCDVYPQKALAFIKPGGYLLVTSCNWTEDELIKWFTTTVEMRHQLTVVNKIKYKVFQFGGHQGQGVASVCFQRTATGSQAADHANL